MSDIKALVAQNDLNLPEEKLNQLKRQAQVGALSYLSPEREMGPFMLFSCGDTLEQISEKTNLPVDVLLVTAMHYKWGQKVQILSQSPKEIQKSLANSILVATFMAVKDDLAAVLSGRKKASDCPLIPKNPAALEKLMTLVSSANNLQEPTTPSSAPIHVNADNVQINQGLPESPKVSEENADKGNESDEEKADKIARLADLTK